MHYVMLCSWTDYTSIYIDVWGNVKWICFYKIHPIFFLQYLEEIIHKDDVTSVYL